MKGRRNENTFSYPSAHPKVSLRTVSWLIDNSGNAFNTRDLNQSLIYPGWPIKQSETPWRLQRRAPLTGEHNREIIEEAQIAHAKIKGSKERATTGHKRKRSGGGDRYLRT